MKKITLMSKMLSPVNKLARKTLPRLLIMNRMRNLSQKKLLSQYHHRLMEKNLTIRVGKPLARTRWPQAIAEKPLLIMMRRMSLISR